MKPKTQRMLFIIAGLIAASIAVFFIMNNFKDNLVFFYTPTQIAQQDMDHNKTIRVGGLVVGESINKTKDLVTFSLTDNNKVIKVQYSGILPALFRENQGIVAQGRLDKDKIFIADNLLAKHDEKYMPPEVAEALEKTHNLKK